MHTWLFCIIFIFLTLLDMTLQQGSRNECFGMLKRRYDITDLGHLNYFHGWVDVQGQGAANDYCRLVGDAPKVFLACALGGTYGQSEYNYISDQDNFDIGYPGTWYMKDEDGDGRDDYCRCLGDDKIGYQVICTRAGKIGFFGSKGQGGQTRTFTPTGLMMCKDRQIHSEFGRIPGFPL